jgi:quercetin dioxygenase-like cupin family protein
MNIRDLNPVNKNVSASSFFKTEQTNAIAIQILKGQQLSEHHTKTEAVLICLDGEAIFENEKGVKTRLEPGSYTPIEAMVKHWVEAVVDSQLILIK